MKIELAKLFAGYRRNTVLEGIDIEFPEHAVITLVGANGCVKSTLLKTAGRILKQVSGSVVLDGKNINSYKSLDLAGKMAILPQSRYIPVQLSVRELLIMGRYPHRPSGWRLGAHDREVIDRIAGVTGLTGLLTRRADTLSGGEMQRTWIAMTLVQEPELLLLDEPTTFLDICTQYEIMELIRKLNLELGIGVIMALHDLNMAARYSDFIAAVKSGRIKYFGRPEDIIKADVLLDVFNIDAEICHSSDGKPYCIPVRSHRDKSPEVKK